VARSSRKNKQQDGQLTRGVVFWFSGFVGVVGALPNPVVRSETRQDRNQVPGFQHAVAGEQGAARIFPAGSCSDRFFFADPGPTGHPYARGDESRGKTGSRNRTGIVVSSVSLVISSRAPGRGPTTFQAIIFGRVRRGT